MFNLLYYMIYKFIQVYGFDLFDKTRINQITSYFSFIQISIRLNQLMIDKTYF